MKIRRWAADRLVRLAYRLDPNRPTARRERGGVWLVTMGGNPLARVSVKAGSVRS